MQDVQSPIIPVVGDLIRAHPGTISLGQGVVHYGPPPQITQSVAEILSDPENHKYQAVDGIAPLRDAIGAKLKVDNGIELGPHRSVVVTAGANLAFMNALLSIADPGDEIILLVPYYFNHEMAVTMISCKPVLVPTDENYQPDLAAIEGAITGRTRAVVTVSPNNPTGAVYGHDMLREINGLCRRRGLYHISDEAYETFTYDGARHFSPGSIEGSQDHTICLYSLSKAYGLASWRIGYMVVPQRLVMPIRKAQDTILICPPVVSQAAAVGAMTAGPDYVRRWLGELGDVRRMVLEQLSAIGSYCTVPPTRGAFYFLLRIDTRKDPMDIVERLVREFAVAVIPGTTFGMTRGCYLRVSYGALEKQSVAEGIGRLVNGLNAIV